MARKRQEPLVGSVQSQKAVVAQVAHIYDSATWVPTERDVAVRSLLLKEQRGDEVAGEPEEEGDRR